MATLALTGCIERPHELLDTLQHRVSGALQSLDGRGALASVELEFRIGVITSGHGFVPGVNAHVFQHILATLRSSRCVALVSDAVTTQQICYADGTRVEGGVAQTKTRQFMQDIKTMSGVGHDIRVCMALETPARLPGPSGPQYSVERIKTRSTFVYKTWKYDLTHVQSCRHLGRDVDRADSYEVELELLPHALDAARLSADADGGYVRHIVLSGLLKCKDLLDMCKHAPRAPPQNDATCT